MTDLAKYHWEVIEINLMGDHTIVGQYSSEEQANRVKEFLEDENEDGASYYINNRDNEAEDALKNDD